MTTYDDMVMIQKLGIRAIVAADSGEFAVGQLLLDVKNGVIYAIKSADDFELDGTLDPGSLIYKWSADSSTINLDMSVSSFAFSPSVSSTQLIGNSARIWRDGEDMDFSIGYSGGTPDSATISELGSPSSWSPNITVNSPFTSASGTATTHDVRFATSVGGAVTFTVSAVRAANTTSPVTRAITVRFQNEFCIGASTVTGSSFASADIRALSSKTAKSSKNGTYSVTTGSGEHIVVAYREPLGESQFTVGVLPGGFSEVHGDGNFLSYANSAVDSSGAAARKTENYYVYRSNNANLGTVDVLVENA